MSAETGKPEIKTRWAELSAPSDHKHYGDVTHCNRCGFCTSQCPTYLATGDEGLSPRGRNQAYRALLEGRLGGAAEASRMFSTCLQCGICTSVCFAEVPTAKLMSAARGKVLEEEGEPFPLRFALRALLPRPWILEPLLKALFLGKRLGLSRALNRLGLLRLASPPLAAADEMVEALPASFARSRLSPASSDARVVQFLACGPNYLRPSVAEATAFLIKASGEKGGCADNVCCGLPGVSLGDAQAARALARKNIDLLERYHAAVVLVDDSSCAAAVKEYPALFAEADSAEDRAWGERARALAARVRDISEWLAEGGAGRPDGGAAVSVTYHDSCKARYSQKIVEAPRKVLSGLSGVKYVELPEADQCCGGGGTYSFLQPEISRAVLERKARNIAATGAEAVLTTGVSCLLQVAFGLRRLGVSVKALHLSEFLAARAKVPSK